LPTGDPADEVLPPVHHAGMGSVQKAILLLYIVAAQEPPRLAQRAALQREAAVIAKAPA
jgi:hypothetical protein